MKKLLRIVLAFTFLGCFSSLARAQTNIPIVSGVAVADVSAGQTSFKIFLSANVSSFSFINPTPGKNVTVLFTQDSTGGRTVTFASNISNTPTITSTANATTVQAFQFDSNSNTWFGVGSSGTGGGISPPAGDLCGSVGTPTVCGVNGGAVPALATLAGTNSSNQFVAATLANGTIFVGNVSSLPVAVTPSGDVSMTNSGVFTVKALNGVTLSGLATGILKNTTVTGVPSIAAVGDFLIGAGCGVLNPTAHSEAIYEGSSNCNFLTPGLTGQVRQSVNGADSIWVSPGIAGRSVAGASDTILADSATALRDRLSTVQYTSGSAVAVTQPQFSASGMGSNFAYSPFQTGAGVVTITPTSTDTINGQASLALTQNTWCAITNPTNSLAWLARCANWVRAGTNITAVPNADGSITLNASAGGAPTFPVNAQTATYQVLAADFSACKTISVASGTFTVTLVASGSQPANGQCINVFNYGSGVVTIARSGQNINGGTASLVLNAGSATAPTSASIVSDGTNYVATVDEGTLGTVTSIATTAPITGGTITSTGTIACATCVTASSPGAGIAHFAGSTQAVTSSAIVAADITNNTITGTQLAASLALVTPLLGTPTSGVLTNETGYLWNNLAAPTGNLGPLAMGANTSIFTTTTAQAQHFAWKNTTAAVVGTSQGSPVNALCGRAFHGSADVEDCLTLGELPGNGNDAAITFTVGHTGTSTGQVDTVFPGPVKSGGSTAGFWALTQGSTSGGVEPCNTANTACFQAPAAVTSYVANVPAGAPTNNNSGILYSNANPAVGTFAKMPQTAFLTSNYTNATTTFSNVTNLSFSVEANTNYKMHCDLDYQTSATTADVKIQITGPASPTAVTYDLVTEVTGSTLSAAVATAFSTSLSEAGTPTITTNFPLTVTMTLINGANAGTVQLQAAATGTGTITIIPGSCQLQ
jgi:hypothetical protein